MFPTVAIRLCSLLTPVLSGVRNNRLPVHVQVLTAVRVYATGSYQQIAGQVYLHPTSQPSVSRIVHRVTAALVALAPALIQFPMTREKREEVAARYNKLCKSNL